MTTPRDTSQVGFVVSARNGWRGLNGFWRGFLAALAVFFLNIAVISALDAIPQTTIDDWQASDGWREWLSAVALVLAVAQLVAVLTLNRPRGRTGDTTQFVVVLLLLPIYYVVPMGLLLLGLFGTRG